MPPLPKRYFQIQNANLVWLHEEAFEEAHNVAKNLTGMDGWRLQQLWSLVGQSAKLPAGELLEVGTAYGGSGYMIAASARHHGLQECFTLCDTYQGLVKSGEHDLHKDGAMKVELTPADIFSLLAQFAPIQVLKGVFPEESSGPLEQSLFRFVHIDVDIYQSAKDILEWVFPRLVVGALVVVDDFEVDSTPGISDLVYELWDLPGTLWLRTGIFQAVMVRV